MARPVWFVKLIQRFFPQRFALARLTRLSFLGKVVDHGLFDGDNIIYLPKDGSVESIQIHESIRTQGDIVLPSQVVEYFIDKSNYHWIMNFCICRDSDGCQDYPVELGCLFLGEAVLNIRSEYGRLVSKDEALEHVRRCQEAGLVHSRKEGLWVNYHLADGSANPYAADLLARLRTWLDQDPEIQRLLARLPEIRREDICKK